MREAITKKDEYNILRFNEYCTGSITGISYDFK